MPEAANPIATLIVYEDDHVRVWNQVVPADGKIAKHQHHHDYYIVNVKGEGPFDIQFHEGTGGDLGDTFTFTPKPGEATFVPKGHIETAHNRGEQYRAILVEFKQP